MRKRPAGADNFLKLRRSLDEHLLSRRMTWNEFAMFVWLCLKASPRTGVVLTSWPQLEIETRLAANHVEQLCRSLRRKRYVWYPWHRGRRGRSRLIELAIDKYPTTDGRYTDLSDRFMSTELAPDPTSGRPIPTDLDMETPEEPRGLPAGRLRRRRDRDGERDRECARARDRRNGRDQEEERARTDERDHTDGHGPAPTWREEIATPVAIRELLAAQPWWRPPADEHASAQGADAGGTTDGSRAAAASGPPPGGASR